MGRTTAVQTQSFYSSLLGSYVDLLGLSSTLVTGDLVRPYAALMNFVLLQRGQWNL